MPPGEAAIKSGPRVGVPDRMQFQSGNDIHQRQWFPDERDAFISWLRGEFAAANAIIDSLCYHLRCVGEPGEYEVAIGCIQQRRSPWIPVLHMQQYFSVADVVHCLQQVAWSKQARHPDRPAAIMSSFPHSKPDAKKPVQIMGGRHGNKGITTENARESHGSDSDMHCPNQEACVSIVNTKKSSGNDTTGAEICKGNDASSRSCIVSENNEGRESQQTASNGIVEEASGTKSGDKEGNPKSTIHKDDINIRKKQDEKQNRVSTPKTFVATEVLDGQTVNVVEGLELYEDLFDNSEVSQLFSLANELRAAGRRGDLQGQTFVPSKRPMKGRGRDILQFGISIIDGPPEDNNGSGSFKDHKVEPIPIVLQEIVDRLVQSQVMTVKPDSCVIDFFNEGDHSQPHASLPWFGRPICSLFVTKCSMVFGGVINTDHPGNFRGALKLSLAAGSLLIMKGKSADVSKHATPSIRKQRIIVTFTKSQPKKPGFADGLRFQSPMPTASWVPLPLPNMIRHPGPKHYNPVPSTGVLQVPPPRPQQLPTNDIQPMFMGTSVVPALPFQSPPVPVPMTTAGWPSVSRPAPARMLVPGTGVFIPPAGPGHTQTQRQAVADSSETTSLVESAPLLENSLTNGQLPEKSEDKLNSNLVEKAMTGNEGLTEKGFKQEIDENVTSASKEEGKEEMSVSKKKQGGKISKAASK